MEQKFRQAAVAYAGVGAIVIILTLLFAVPARKAGLLLSVAPGLFFVLVFAYLVYKKFRILTMVLGALAGVRTIIFLLNFLGLHVEFLFTGMSFHVLPTVPFRPIFLINGLFTAFIAYMLARAAWDL